ncbi:CsxC family protein [Actinomycetes bacterium NPDC127524]
MGSQESEHLSGHQTEHFDQSAHHHVLPVPGGPCPVTPTPLSTFTSANTTVEAATPVSRIKVPVVLAEPTIQIPIEATIKLGLPATEIKRVKKNVFLDQVKIVPVPPFTRVDGTDFFTFGAVKLFIAGHIRKNIEFASHECKGTLHDRIVDIPFTGFTELSTANGTLLNPPIFGINETSESSFLSDVNPLNGRLDKFFFQNLVKYNEQPFGELVAANFFELDFSPIEPAPEGTFTKLTEKIVLDLTVKVLQIQQLAVSLTPVVPLLPGLTPPVGP